MWHFFKTIFYLGWTWLEGGVGPRPSPIGGNIMKNRVIVGWTLIVGLFPLYFLASEIWGFRRFIEEIFGDSKFVKYGYLVFVILGVIVIIKIIEVKLIGNRNRNRWMPQGAREHVLYRHARSRSGRPERCAICAPYCLNLLSRSAFEMTETEERLIATAATKSCPTSAEARCWWQKWRTGSSLPPRTSAR